MSNTRHARPHERVKHDPKNGGKAKHRVRFLRHDKQPMMKPARRLSGRPVDPDREYLVTFTYPWEGSMTAPRPWTVRNQNRARNKRERAGRKANR